MKILAFCANGSEDAEFIITVDLLRRAKVDVSIVSVENESIYTSHNVQIRADKMLKDMDKDELMSYDGLFLPGGKVGVSNLIKSNKLISLIKDFYNCGKLVSAICAAPTVLAKANIMSNHKFTCYDGFESLIDGDYMKAMPYVIDSNIITGRSLNYTIDFALAIIEYLVGKDERERVEKGILKV